jgi:hypothetical protein
MVEDKRIAFAMLCETTGDVGGGREHDARAEECLKQKLEIVP